MLPTASSSILPNTDLRDSIIERIQHEQDESKSCVKRVAADRVVRSLAKRETWQSTKKMIEYEAS